MELNMSRILVLFCILSAFCVADDALKYFDEASKTQDSQKSIELLSKSCELGNNDACSAIGYFSLNNDIDAGMKIIVDSCRSGSGLGCAILYGLSEEKEFQDEFKKLACEYGINDISVRFLNSINIKNPCF